MNYSDECWQARENLNYNIFAGVGRWIVINRKLNQDTQPYSMEDVANFLKN